MRFLPALLTVFPAFAQSLVLESGAARMNWDLAGGGLVDFHLKDGQVNPLTWEDGTGAAVRLRGHFICLDRWGAPSDAEKAAGMPYHGEAPRIRWRQIGKTASDLEMAVQLPMARLAVKRTVHLEDTAAVVTESVTNENPLGRVYNFVQHPTIAPPFLDETTVVDANARQGLMQSSPMPNPEHPTVVWPQALKDGVPVSLRFLKDDPQPNVVSYVIDDEFGWTTVITPGKALLLGYVWRTADYPWFSAWRDVRNGKPSARGLEFGTTGLHQPYPVLVRKGRIFGRPLFAFLDAAQTETRRYQAFLLRVPTGLTGIDRMRRERGEFLFDGRDGKQYRVRDLLR